MLTVNRSKLLGQLTLTLSIFVWLGCQNKSNEFKVNSVPPAQTFPAGSGLGTSPIQTLSALVVNPVSSVLTSNSVSVQVTGGQPPYQFTVLSGAGTFAGNIFNAPATAQAVTAQVTDSAGQRSGFTISVIANTTTMPVATPTPIMSTTPVTYDVYSTPYCAGVYCSCGTPGLLGVPFNDAAASICGALGHGYLIGYSYLEGPVGEYQCDPYGQNCYINQDPGNIVCATVTCQ